MTDPTGHSPSATLLTAGGALAGAAIGAVLGGPVGAVVGAITGGLLGNLSSSLLSMPGNIFGPCSPAMTIDGLAVARVTDLNVCALFFHPPSSIASGSMSVLFDGLPVARQTDSIVCGAKITSGSATVLIGGPTEVFPFNVIGTQAFIRDVQESLADIYATPTGKKIIRGIGETDHTTKIEATSANNGFCAADDYSDAQNPNEGSGSVIEWNPAHNATLDNGLGHTVTLGHELVHAYHNATGTNANGPQDTYPGQTGSSARGEERQTVGSGGTTITTPSGTTATVPDYSSTVPTEDSLRDDLNLPRRNTYYPPTWPGGPPW